MVSVSYTHLLYDEHLALIITKQIDGFFPVVFRQKIGNKYGQPVPLRAVSFIQNGLRNKTVVRKFLSVERLQSAEKSALAYDNARTVFNARCV